MPSDRIEALRRMAERSPDDPRAHFGLALELEKRGQWEEAVTELRRYLELAEDQGNAWGRLGNALYQLGRVDEARAAYESGVETARRHGHPSMATEFEDAIANLSG